MTRSIQIFSIVGFLLTWPVLAEAQVAFRTVALTGTHAPGTPTDVTFSSVGFAGVNDAGRVAFSAGLISTSGGTLETSISIWSEASGTLKLVARSGSPASGAPPGVNFDHLGIFRPSVNAAGRTAFFATLQGTGVTSKNDAGIWSEGHGSLALVAREGSQAPGAPAGANFSGFLGGPAYTPLLNNAGQTAFMSSLENTSGIAFGPGIWSEGAGDLSLVALSGDQAPGAPLGFRFGNFDGLVLNSLGQTAFLAGWLQGGQFSGDKGIWSQGTGTLAAVAYAGEQAPGAPPGVSFLSFRDPALNDAGQTAFAARLQTNEGGVALDIGDGIWSEGSGTLALVARVGSHAPGTPEGTNFSRFGDPVLNAAGRTAFRGELYASGGGVTLSNYSGIWSEGSGALTLVARQGSHAPGTPPGAVFGDFSSFLGTPVINSSGRTAFRALLKTGGDVTTANDEGIWAEDQLGKLTLVARAGDLFEAAPGDYRTIAGFNFQGFFPAGGGEDGRPVVFNDNFTLVFFAYFTDSSAGIFTATLTVVPEPATFNILIVASVLVFTYSHRRRAPLASCP